MEDLEKQSLNMSNLIGPCIATLALADTTLWKIECVGIVREKARPHRRPLNNSLW
jgi:hypothetical protein